jgi:VIT1/CCC1 family predicted Fe2+/Mn2+ transporter
MPEEELAELAELGIDEDEVVSPWNAALASAVAFTLGAALPLAAVLLIPEPWRVGITFAVVLVALAGTGWIAAWIGAAPRVRATARVVVGGALALGATFAVGSLLGTTAAG